MNCNKQITRIAEELGLIEITTERQKKNGTREFVDPIATYIHGDFAEKIGYGIYSSGMVRRISVRDNGLWLNKSMYQLNPTKSKTVGVSREVTRIPLTPLEAVGLLAYKVVQYRDYLDENLRD